MTGESMPELGRTHWRRQGLRLAYTAVMVWLAIPVMTALMPKAAPVAGTWAILRRERIARPGRQRHRRGHATSTRGPRMLHQPAELVRNSKAGPPPSYSRTYLLCLFVLPVRSCKLVTPRPPGFLIPEPGVGVQAPGSAGVPWGKDQHRVTTDEFSFPPFNGGGATGGWRATEVLADRGARCCPPVHTPRAGHPPHRAVGPKAPVPEYPQSQRPSENPRILSDLCLAAAGNFSWITIGLLNPSRTDR